MFQSNDIKDLAQKVKKGDWSFPKSIDFSVQGIQFLNCTLQYDVTKRLNWDELSNHPYLTTTAKDIIPLNFKFPDQKEEGKE